MGDSAPHISIGALGLSTLLECIEYQEVAIGEQLLAQEGVGGGCCLASLGSRL